MKLENDNIFNLSRFSGAARVLLCSVSSRALIISVGGCLTFSVNAQAQTVIMLEDNLKGSIDSVDPINAEKLREETLRKKIAPKKVIGRANYQPAAPAPNRAYRQKRGFIKSKASEQAGLGTGLNATQPVFSQPIENNNASNVRSLGASVTNTSSAMTSLRQGGNARVQQLPSNLLNSQQAQSSTRGRVQSELAQTAVLDDVNIGTPSRKGNNRIAPVEAGTRRTPRVNPFVAQGYKVGSWVAFASLRQSIAFTDNLDGTANSESGAVSQSDFEFSTRSDWSRHQAQISASLGYRKNFGGSDSKIPTANVSGDLRLDLVDGFNATARVGYSHTTEAVTSTTLTSNVIERPGVQTLNGSVGLARSGNRVSLNLRGSVDRTLYENAKLSGGGVLSQKDRDNTLYQLTARASYGVSQAFTPFVEANVGKRHYDLNRDRNNEDRNATIYGFSVGAEIDLGEKLTGEYSIGYNIEDYADTNLRNLEGFTFDSALVWSPIRETSVTLNTSTQFSGATTTGVSGSIINNASVSVSRQVTDRTRLDATTGVVVTTDTDYAIDTVLWNIGTSFEYALNNNLALTGGIEYDQQFSDTASRAYDATTIRTGIRLQR